MQCGLMDITKETFALLWEDCIFALQHILSNKGFKQGEPQLNLKKCIFFIEVTECLILYLCHPSIVIEIFLNLIQL